jgi:phage terminase large subunit
MNLSSNFSKIYAAYRTGGKLIVQQGSQGSGKTFSTLQLLYFLASQKKCKRIITVCSFALPHLKGGAMRDFEKIIEENVCKANINHNKSNNTYHINNSIIEFFGIEGNEAKAHGLRRDILYINEANRRIDYKVFDQMFSRTHECTIIDFNPSNEFWYHEKIKGNFAHSYIHSTFADNEYLPQSERENILSKKNKPGFENWWRVYGLGELGKLEDCIINNWGYGDFDVNLPYSYGLDFGSKDPDALVKVAIDRGKEIIYADEIIYNNNLSTNELSNLIKSKITLNSLIIADSASPRTIQDLKLTGLNIKPVVKGTGSVNEGIKVLQNFKIIITENSYNLAKELNNWVWLDKKGSIPLDANNHLIDAMRYNVQTMINPFTRKSHKLL